MPNPSRVTAVADAGLTVLAEHGMRGLTHRAVDEAAGLPSGSCSNVFRSRAALIEALATRIFERLTPDTDYLEEHASATPNRDHWVQLMVDLVERAKAQPELHLALLELRLEATRRPELRDPLASVVRLAFDADVDFHTASGLAGSAHEIVLLHLAIGGLITELLTLPEALALEDTSAIIEDLVDRIVFTTTQPTEETSPTR